MKQSSRNVHFTHIIFRVSFVYNFRTSSFSFFFSVLSDVSSRYLLFGEDI